jgi:putative NIF3 family GTP cyclohydrolase 1 type 2
LEAVGVLEAGAEAGAGFGVLACLDDGLTLTEWAARVGDCLHSAPLALSGGPTERHARIALMGGSGGGQIDAALAAGATLYLTADIRYHEAQRARAGGLSLIVLDHYASEQPVLARVAAHLRGQARCRVDCSAQRTTPWEARAP